MIGVFTSLATYTHTLMITLCNCVHLCVWATGESDCPEQNSEMVVLVKTSDDFFICIQVSQRCPCRLFGISVHVLRVLVIPLSDVLVVIPGRRVVRTHHIAPAQRGHLVHSSSVLATSS